MTVPSVQRAGAKIIITQRPACRKRAGRDGGRCDVEQPRLDNARPPPRQHASPLRYQEHTCKQLVFEMDFANERLGQLYTALDKKAGNDAAQMGIGLVLFRPALFFLEGGDGVEAADYARLRGEVDAMHRAGVAKECDLRGVHGFTPPQKEAVPVKDT